MTRELPGIPRKPFRSRPDYEEPVPERVYEILQGFDGRIGGLEEDSAQNKRDNSTILTELREIKATDRHATTKLIAGLATTAILTIGGILGGTAAMRPGTHPPEVPARSALDMRLDECRPIQEAGTRAQCFARVFEESPK